MKPDLEDLMIVIGLCLIAWGCSLIYLPLAPLVIGFILFGGGVILSKPKRTKKKE